MWLFPPLFQPCKQQNNPWQQSEGRKAKHVNQLAVLPSSAQLLLRGGAFFCLLLFYFFCIVFCFLPVKYWCFLQREAWKGEIWYRSLTNLCILTTESQVLEMLCTEQSEFPPYPPRCHTEITEPGWCSFSFCKSNMRRNQERVEWNCQII